MAFFVCIDNNIHSNTHVRELKNTFQQVGESTSQKRIEEIRVSESVLSDFITLVHLIKRFKHFTGICLREKKSWLDEQGLEIKMWIVIITRVMIGSWRQSNYNLIGLPTSRKQVCVCVRARIVSVRKNMSSRADEKKFIKE
jgi:hypothetical protein